MAQYQEAHIVDLIPLVLHREWLLDQGHRQDQEDILQIV